MKYWVILGLSTLGWANPIKNSPIVLEKSDEMRATRSAGIYDLIGNVQMRHDVMRLNCDAATWNGAGGILELKGNFRFTHPDAYLTSDQGRYDRNNAVAQAWEKAVYRSGDRKLKLSGHAMNYARTPRVLDVTLNATLIEYPNTKDKNSDTLVILADRFNYNENTQVAQAWGNARVKQGPLWMRADSIVYNRRDTSLFLLGHAQAHYETYRSTANVLRSFGGGKKIRLLEAFGQSVGLVLRDTTLRDTTTLQNRLAGDTLRAHFADGQLHKVVATNKASGTDYREPDSTGRFPPRSVATGDTLIAEFLQKKIHSMLAFPQGQGVFYGQYQDQLPSQASGDTLRIQFLQGKTDSAWALGNAKATMQQYDVQIYQGYNTMSGNQMIVDLDRSKAKSMEVEGQLAKGKWLGEPVRKRKKVQP